MSWIQFDGKSNQRVAEPAVSINKAGRLFLNRQAREILNGHTHVRLFFDPEQARVGLQFCSDDKAHALRLSTRGTLGLFPFLKRFGIKIAEAGVYPLIVHLDEDQPPYQFDLSSEIPARLPAPAAIDVSITEIAESGASDPESKVCSVCLKPRPLSDFALSGGHNPSGARKHQCRKCIGDTIRAAKLGRKVPPPPPNPGESTARKYVLDQWRDRLPVNSGEIRKLTGWDLDRIKQWFNELGKEHGRVAAGK